MHSRKLRDVLPDTKGWACHPEDHFFVADKKQSLPPKLHKRAMSHYNYLMRGSSREFANSDLEKLSVFCSSSPVPIANSEMDTRKQAAACCRDCTLYHRNTINTGQGVKKILQYVLNHGIDTSAYTDKQVVARSQSERW